MQRIILIACLSVFLSACAVAEDDISKTVRVLKDPPSLVDYDGFVKLSQDVAAYRKTRLLSVKDYVAKSKQKGVIILDTRSKAAYDAIHMKGAIHLNFSDFTAEKLQKLIPDKKTTILIYCNNNVSSNEKAFLSKKVTLALNVPTFINLYGYGYKNIYELRDLVTLDDRRIAFVRSAKSNFNDAK